MANGPLYGVAYDLPFSLYKTDASGNVTVIGNPGTYTKRISKDGGALVDSSASVTEVDTTYGALTLPLSATEMSCARLWGQVKDDTAGCIPFTFVLEPQTWIDTSGNIVGNVEGSVASVAAAVTCTDASTVKGYFDSSGNLIGNVEGTVGADASGNIAAIKALLEHASYGLEVIENEVWDMYSIEIASIRSTLENATYGLNALHADLATASGYAASGADVKGYFDSSGNLIGNVEGTVTTSDSSGVTTLLSFYDASGNLSGSVASVANITVDASGNVQTAAGSDSAGVTTLVGYFDSSGNLKGSVEGSVASVVAAVATALDGFYDTSGNLKGNVEGSVASVVSAITTSLDSFFDASGNLVGTVEPLAALLESATFGLAALKVLIEAVSTSAAPTTGEINTALELAHGAGPWGTAVPSGYTAVSNATKIDSSGNIDASGTAIGLAVGTHGDALDGAEVIAYLSTDTAYTDPKQYTTADGAGAWTILLPNGQSYNLVFTHSDQEQTVVLVVV